MKIHFHLGWLETVRGKKTFKSAAAQELFADYVERLSHFTPAETAGAYGFEKKKEAGQHLWVCDFHARSKTLSSEDLAEKIKHLLDAGTKALHLAVGGADGFTAGERKNMRPDFIWSFGPMTLPHELAAVVAAEQFYRAWTILKGLPYHTKHAAP